MLFRFIAFPMIMVHGYCSWNIFLWFIQVSTGFQRLFRCYFAAPISLSRTFRRKNHPHTWLFFFENHGQSFFLNHKSWILFLRIVPIWRNSWNFSLQKTNSAKNIYFPKYIFRKNLFLWGNTNILVSCIDILLSGPSVFYLLNV